MERTRTACIGTASVFRKGLACLLAAALVLSLGGAPVAYGAEAGEGAAALEGAITIQAQKAGSLTVTSQWGGPVVVSRDGGQDVTLQGDSPSTTLTVSAGEQVTVSEGEAGVTFRSWRQPSSGLVSGVPCAMTSMPGMSAFTTDGTGTTAGDCFFSGFNSGGSLSALPAGSFDTSAITTVGDGFFWGFNAGGSLAALPEGSFDTSGITAAGDYFFMTFNRYGSLSALPAGSFDTSGVTAAGDSFFFAFDVDGSLGSLPRSFRLPQALSSVGSDYCAYMFGGSALVAGDQAVPLYFAAAATDAFKGTGIAPESPAAGTTVHVNGEPGWSPPAVCTVSFDAHGGTVSPLSVKVASGAAVGALPAPKRTGHTFAGWFTAAAGGTRVTASTPVTADVTWYAHWTAVACTVKFDANGGKVAGKAAASVKRAYGQALGKLAKPVRTGYDFLGWHTGKVKGTKVGAGTKVAKDVTYYAHWKAKGPVVTLNANGGKVGKAATASVVRAKGAAIGRLATPVRAGYSFLGWHTGKMKGTKVTAKAKATRNITLYAHWKAKAYTVKLDANGGRLGKAPTSSLKKAYNSKLGKLAVPKRGGHQFLGWYTKKAGGEKVTAGTRVTKAVTLYAHWKRVR
jgi:uncharacterized repeat protein (TIGR02543 family)